MAIGRFAGKPLSEGPELDALKAVICPKFSGQLAALIQGNIPGPIAELVVFKVGVHAGALDVLAALYSPHLQPSAVARQNAKDRDLVECNGLQKPLGFRYLLYSFLIRWLAAIKRLTANSGKKNSFDGNVGVSSSARRGFLSLRVVLQMLT